MNFSYYRKRLSQKSEGLARNVLVRTLSAALPYYIVNEYPKSGGTWVAQMLSAMLGVPFPRNRSPILRSSIMHGHYFQPYGMNNVIMVWRDPRDLMVSLYYHCYFVNDRENSVLVQLMRRQLPFDDYKNFEKNFPIFLERMLSNPPWPRHRWQDFAQMWLGRTNVHHVTYEDMRLRPDETLGRICWNLTKRSPNSEDLSNVIQQFSFERQAGRRPGTESRDSFLRKGIVGDWKNQFTLECREIFEHHAGSYLIDLGYEKDSSWASS